MDRNKNLDGARGLAALCVAVGHCLTHYNGISVWPLKIQDLIGTSLSTIAARLWYSVFQADAAVVLFFVLSGYVLSRALESRHEPPLRAFAPYVVRRAFRLFPVAIASALVLASVIPLPPHIVAGHMLLINNSVNGPIWSLQVELIGCLFVFLLWAVGNRVFALACIIAAVALTHYTGMWQFLFLPAFALGYLIPELPATVWCSRAVLIVSLAVLMLADLFLGKEGFTVRTAEALGAFGVVGCITRQHVGFLLSRPIQFLGAVSYPFYLAGIASLIWAGPIADALMHSSVIVVRAAVIALISVPFAIVVAWLIHRYVEMPAMRDGNKLLKAVLSRNAQPIEGSPSSI